MSEKISHKISVSEKKSSKLNLKQSIQNALVDKNITTQEAQKLNEIMNDILNVSSEARKQWRKLPFLLRKEFQERIGAEGDGAIGVGTMKSLGKLADKGKKIKKSFQPEKNHQNIKIKKPQFKKDYKKINKLKNEKGIEQKEEVKKYTLDKSDLKYIRELYFPVDLMMGGEVNIHNINNLHKTIIESQSKLEDYLYEKFNINDKGFVGRVLFAMGIGVLYVPGMVASTTGHEFSHNTVSDNAGAKNLYYGVKGGKSNLTLGELFFEGLKSPFSTKYSHKEGLTIEESYGVAGAGLNFNNFLANEGYKDMIVDYKKGSITKNGNYLFNKAVKSIYSFRPDMEGHDINNFIEDLKNQGYDLTKEEVKIYSLLSLLTSGGTINALKNLGKFVYKGERVGEPIGFDFGDFTLYLPEFNTWLNSNNFSAEILQYIRYGNTIFELGIEKAIVGKEENIYTLGIDRKDGKNHYKGQVKSNGSDGYNINMRYQRELTKDGRLALGLTGNYNEGNIGENRADMGFGKTSASLDLSWKF